MSSVLTPLFRGSLALALAFCASCGPQAARELPRAAGAWTLASQDDAEAPPVLRQLGLKSARLYRYQGPEAIELRAYEMTSSAGAFEGLQRWQVRPGTLPFSKDAFLFEPSAPAAASTEKGKAALEAFVPAFRAVF
jgi:hypothetical protein